MARHKRGLTHWRGGRGRSGLVNSKVWHVTNEDSLAGGEEEGGAGWGASKRGTTQRKNQVLEGRKREGVEGALLSEARPQWIHTSWQARAGWRRLVSFQES